MSNGGCEVTTWAIIRYYGLLKLFEVSVTGEKNVTSEFLYFFKRISWSKFGLKTDE